MDDKGSDEADVYAAEKITPETDKSEKVEPEKEKELCNGDDDGLSQLRDEESRGTTDADMEDLHDEAVRENIAKDQVEGVQENSSVEPIDEDVGEVKAEWLAFATRTSSRYVSEQRELTGKSQKQIPPEIKIIGYASDLSAENVELTEGSAAADSVLASSSQTPRQGTTSSGTPQRSLDANGDDDTMVEAEDPARLRRDAPSPVYAVNFICKTNVLDKLEYLRTTDELMQYHNGLYIKQDFYRHELISENAYEVDQFQHEDELGDGDEDEELALPPQVPVTTFGCDYYIVSVYTLDEKEEEKFADTRTTEAARELFRFFSEPSETSRLQRLQVGGMRIRLLAYDLFKFHSAHLSFDEDSGMPAYGRPDEHNVVLHAYEAGENSKGNINTILELTGRLKNLELPLLETITEIRKQAFNKIFVGKASENKSKLPVNDQDPEAQATNSLAPTTTPKSTGLKRDFGRSDSSVSEDGPKEREVPPSPKEPTNSLRIDRFLRPSTLKAVQELLGKTGNVTSFWMDHIKNHCYVSYASVEEAVATREAVYNYQWPPNGDRLLTAEFVGPEEVKAKLEAPPPQLQPQAQAPFRPPPTALPPPPPLAKAPPVIERVHLPPPPPLVPEEQEPPIATLDDLFKKT